MKHLIPLFFLTILLSFNGCKDQEAVAPDPPESGYITLVNNSFYTISIFRFRVAGTDRWGNNYLSVADPLPPGEQATYYMPPGMYDLRLEDAQSTVMWTFNNRAINKDEYTTVEF